MLATNVDIEERRVRESGSEPGSVYPLLDKYVHLWTLLPAAPQIDLPYPLTFAEESKTKAIFRPFSLGANALKKV